MWLRLLLVISTFALAAAGCGGGGGGGDDDVGGASQGGTSSAPVPRTATPLPTLLPPDELKAQLAALPANGALYVGPYKWTDTGGHWAGAAITDYSALVYSPTLRSMLIFGGGHASTDYDAVNTFSMPDLDWQELYLSTPASLMTPTNYDSLRGAWRQGPSGPYARPAARHTVDELVVAGDELIVLAQVEGNGQAAGSNWPTYTSFELKSPARIAHFNLNTRQWTFAQDDSGPGDWPAAEYDPPSGKVLLLGTKGVFVYDPATKKNTLAIDLSSFPGAFQLVDEQGNWLPVANLSYNQNLVYYPPNGRHYYFVNRATSGYPTTGSVFELTLDRQDFTKSVVRRVANAPLTVGENLETRFAYDSKNGLIGGGLSDGVFHAFDPRVKTWAAKTVNGPQKIAFMAMDYDPENNVYVMVTTDRQTWVYRWQ